MPRGNICPVVLMQLDWKSGGIYSATALYLKYIYSVTNFNAQLYKHIKIDLTVYILHIPDIPLDCVS